ncbi:TPA: hypothetical protein UN036_000428 [Stenotrophomonas maltophilia]|uniref:hypothetical protein n=2 Tax=Pseudomonadota TaxID=1224 RepID=UPI0025E283F7|nr:hypothetical protein [Sphingomonas sp.]HEL4661132.1 hypothetical protein [Stenotrophomonas maltophilia]
MIINRTAANNTQALSDPGLVSSDDTTKRYSNTLSVDEVLTAMKESHDPIWDRVFKLEPYEFSSLCAHLHKRACGHIIFYAKHALAQGRERDELANAMARSCYQLMGMDEGLRPLDRKPLVIRDLEPFLSALARTTPEQRQRVVLERAIAGCGPNHGVKRRM